MSLNTQRVAPFYDAAQFASSEVVDFRVWFSSGFLMQSRQEHQESFHSIAIIFIIGLDLALTLFFTCIFLRSFRHHFRTLCRSEMATVKQTQKMIPFVTCEISLG